MDSAASSIAKSNESSGIMRKRKENQPSQQKHIIIYYEEKEVKELDRSSGGFNFPGGPLRPSVRGKNTI